MAAAEHAAAAVDRRRCRRVSSGTGRALGRALGRRQARVVRARPNSDLQDGVCGSDLYLYAGLT